MFPENDILAYMKFTYSYAVPFWNAHRGEVILSARDTKLF